MPVEYRHGDLFQLLPKNKSVIVPHVCNDIGAWGSGFVMAVSKHYPIAEDVYRNHSLRKNLQLGDVHLVNCGNVTIMNMIAQTSLISRENPRPLNYAYLYKCMLCICNNTISKDVEIHAPKFGSDRAGGNWDFIEKMIEDIWCDFGFKVFVYSL